MDEFQVYQKVKDAIKAVEQYQNTVNEGKAGMWKSDIEKGLETLTEKRHVLASSGQTCSCCNGSGRG